MQTEQTKLEEKPVPAPPLKTKIDVKDTHEMDKRVPRELVIMYQEKAYITKAGLEWKATMLFGGGSYGVETEIIERTPEYVLAKAVFTTKDGVKFSNFGEASKQNVNTRMQNQLLHLAITRAENRVLRMVTACGYVSTDEMDFSADAMKDIPVGEKDAEPITPAQSDLVTKLGGKVTENMTQGEAKQVIGELLNKKKE